MTRYRARGQKHLKRLASCLLFCVAFFKGINFLWQPTETSKHVEEKKLFIPFPFLPSPFPSLFHLFLISLPLSLLSLVLLPSSSPYPLFSRHFTLSPVKGQTTQTTPLTIRKDETVPKQLLHYVPKSKNESNHHHLLQVAQCAVPCPFLADIACHYESLCRSTITVPPPGFPSLSFRCR